MPDETRKFKRYTHSPFTFEWNGVKIDVNENGKIILTQENTEDGVPIEDRITTSAGLIYRLASMLSASKKITWEDTPYKENE